MIVTNGDGRGTDEVRTYELFLNGERVVPTDHSRTAQATVKLRPNNTLKVTLNGGPTPKYLFYLPTIPVNQSERIIDAAETGLTQWLPNPQQLQGG